jgi:hypothetical protein
MSASARTQGVRVDVGVCLCGRGFYRVCGRLKPVCRVNVDAGGCPDGNFYRRTSIMTTLNPMGHAYSHGGGSLVW